MKKSITNWNDVPVIFDLAFASILCGKSVVRLRQLASKGLFPAYKIGNEWRVRKEDFRVWETRQLEITYKNKV